MPQTSVLCFLSCFIVAETVGSLHYKSSASQMVRLYKYEGFFYTLLLKSLGDMYHSQNGWSMINVPAKAFEKSYKTIARADYFS